MKKIAVALVLSAALLAVAASAAGAKTHDVPPIAYGVADDTGKYADDGGAWFDSMLKGANLTEVRWTLSYNGDPTTITELPFIQRAAPQAQKDGVHVVLALYGRPATQHDPVGFCTWAGMVANTVKQWGIDDFIVWNEPNTSLYWSPQNSYAPAAYEALLALCYDAIHNADAGARVIGFGLSPRSNGPGQTPPIPFIAGVGAAYKASGRTTPIMDQMSIHPYPNPNSPTDGPDVGYPNPNNYGVPNLDRVKQAIWDAFHGTGQPTTLNGLTFRIDELGWQTNTQSYPQYYNNENVAVVSEQTQATYIQQTVQKYFACDPTVTDVEWFLLVDEPTRNGRNQSGTVIGGGWQSGLLTAGGQGVSTPKAAYAADAPLFAAGRSACTSGLVNWTPSGAGGSTGSSGSGSGGTGGGSTTTLPPDFDAYVSLFGKTSDSQSQYQQLLQGLSDLSMHPTQSLTNSLLNVKTAQQTLSTLLAGFPTLAQDTSLQSVLVGFFGNVKLSAGQLQQALLQLFSQQFRRSAAASGVKSLVVAAASAKVAAGGTPALTLEALHAKTRLANGTYYLALLAQSAADPSQRITLAVPVMTVGKKAAKPAKKPKPGKPQRPPKGPKGQGSGKANERGGGTKPHLTRTGVRSTMANTCSESSSSSPSPPPWRSGSRPAPPTGRGRSARTS